MTDSLALAIDLGGTKVEAALVDSTGSGVGAAGPLTESLGLVSPLNLPAWRDYPLKALVEDAAPRLPVTLRMDGLCIALAEHWVGAAQGYENVMGMIVSTGIGGGLILHGNTVSGPTGNAGHIGDRAALCFECAIARGGSFDEREDRWVVPPGLAGLERDDL